MTRERVPEHHADWWYDLRRKQLHIYGGLLRYIDSAIAAGKPKDFVKQIPAWIDWYIEEQYEPTPPAALKLSA